MPAAWTGDPPPDTPTTDARDYAAVRLFVVRGRDVAPGFSLDETNVADVVRICRMLDGLRLAIELAAARLRVLTPAQVAARLDDRFRLLTHGSRTAQPRHQTLRAVVGWSWDLLDEAEQTHARRLTVFSGGASLTAVEAVCGVPADDALELLTSLVDKSFVGSNAGRFWMLETIRAFAAERLTAAGEEEQLWRAHARYFVALAETADPHLRRAEQREWLADWTWSGTTCTPRCAGRPPPGTGTPRCGWYRRSPSTGGCAGCGAKRPTWRTAAREVGNAAPAGRGRGVPALRAAGVAGAPRRTARSAGTPCSRRTACPTAVPVLPVGDRLRSAQRRPGGAARNGRAVPAPRAPDPWIQALSPVGVGLLLVMRGEAERAESAVDATHWPGSGRSATGGDDGRALRGGGVADARGSADGRPPVGGGARPGRAAGSNMDVAELLHTRGSRELRPGGELDARPSATSTRALGWPGGRARTETAAAARYGLAEAARGAT